MISTRPQPYTLTDEIFDRSLQVIQRSGAVELIESYHAQTRGPGGRPRCGRRFTLLAVLVVGLAVMRVGRAASMAEIFRVIGTLTPVQLSAVGMDPDDAPEPEARQGGYPAFHGWLTRLLAPLDSGADLPARRVSNKEHKQQIAERSVEQVEASETALSRLHEVVNAIVAASVDDKLTAGYAGDIIADETIVDLAGPSDGLGTKDDKHRSAAYMARYYVRDGSDNSVRSRFGDVVQFKKAAVGIGVTAVSRVGTPDNLYGVGRLRAWRKRSCINRRTVLTGGRRVVVCRI